MTSNGSGTRISARTVGVEEELMLVDAETGAARSSASAALRVARRRGETEEALDDDTPGGSLGPELQEQQLETDTPPEEHLELLAGEITRWREKARAAAAETGCLVLASGTSPLPAQPQASPDPRYEEITSRFGLTALEQLTCGCHVHVAVDSDEEAVGVLDRIRLWLPVLLALSANSPYWQGEDSGYQSYRSPLLTRWPTNGPTEIFGSAQAYDDHLRLLLGTGVPIDEGMAYFDARPSHHFPTVEVRVADVCLDPVDTVLLAGLARALVDTAAAEWTEERPAAEASVALLRLAMWQAARHGMEGDLLDPRTHAPRPAREVVASLMDHVEPALRRNGDVRRVEQGLDRMAEQGTGSVRQRRVVTEEGRLDRAVLRLARLT